MQHVWERGRLAEQRAQVWTPSALFGHSTPLPSAQGHCPCTCPTFRPCLIKIVPLGCVIPIRAQRGCWTSAGEKSSLGCPAAGLLLCSALLVLQKKRLFQSSPALSPSSPVSPTCQGHRDTKWAKTKENAQSPSTPIQKQCWTMQ